MLDDARRGAEARTGHPLTLIVACDDPADVDDLLPAGAARVALELAGAPQLAESWGRS
ncbi:hypothetical protein [Agromyces mangrovi Wang et al. 2018]|uniref:hypothetical protein n=1 Tax=Agromyces mangrovi TaxID=1858653 RepID=UPI002573D0F7|nr:hypothetical protein [Agromyces mangrovi]